MSDQVSHLKRNWKLLSDSEKKKANLIFLGNYCLIVIVIEPNIKTYYCLFLLYTNSLLFRQECEFSHTSMFTVNFMVVTQVNIDV